MGRSSAKRAQTATWSGASTDRCDTIRDLDPTAPTMSERGDLRLVESKPDRLGPYRLLSVLGEGGVARVYLAEHTIIGKRVAIKMLLPEFEHIREAHDMLMREARIAGMLRHPSLVDVYDYATDRYGRPYLVMQLALGETLHERIERAPLLLSQALDVGIRIADAVEAVHRAGFLHRDIKAENVLLTHDGQRLGPKLIDFGIARPIAPTDEDRLEGIVGTPRTMAPEQVSQDSIDCRTDIWALGILLYEMLTGRSPFPCGATMRDDLIAIVTEPPRALPLSLPKDVRSIVESCLSKDPEGRPASAAELVDQLSTALSGYVTRHDMIERRLVADEAWQVVSELGEQADELAA